MSKIWKPQSIEIYKEWLDAIINEASDELNDWENTFISDIAVRIGMGALPTEAQATKLESIYTKYTD